MKLIHRIGLRYSFALTLASVTVAGPAGAKKERLVLENWAELSVYNVGGIGGQCTGLVDVKFGMVNGNKPQAIVSDEEIYVERSLYDRIEQQALQEAAARQYVSVTVNGKPAPPGTVAARMSGGQQLAAWHRFAKEKLNAYGQQRQAQFYAELDNRPDIVAGAGFAFFTHENNEIKKHYIAQTTLSDCYAASLATAFKYLGLTGSLTDFVNRRNGVCPKLRGSDRSATYGEIRAAIQSTLLNEQTPAFNFTLPPQSRGFLQRRVFRQQYVREGFLSDQARGFFVEPNPALIGNFVGLFSPSLARHLPSVNRSTIPQIPQAAPEQFVDKNGAAINLWDLWKWHYNANPTVGGYIWPMKSTGDLISAVIGGDAVMIGFGNESSGHTVLVTGIKFTPRIKYLQDSVYFTARSVVHSVRVLDPMLVDSPEYWVQDMDKFFRDYRFGIALANGVKN